MRKSFLLLYFFSFLSADEWVNFPSNITLNSGENATIIATGQLGTGGTYLYNYGNFTYTTNGTTHSTLTIKPKSPLVSFYNYENINVLANSNLILDLGTTFVLEASSSYNIAENASLKAIGSEFTMYGGRFINQGNTTLNFPIITIKSPGNSALINNGGKLEINAQSLLNGRTALGVGAYGVFETTASGTTIVNIDPSQSGSFSNFGYVYKYNGGGSVFIDKELKAISIVKSTLGGNLIINGGDVFNGGDVARKYGLNSVYYDSGAGYIIADNAKIQIQKNLISQGAGSQLNALNASDIVRSRISAINGGIIAVNGNFTNKSYSDIYLNNAGQIIVGGSFDSGKNTNIYFSGSSTSYGKIEAKNIQITGANVFLYKGDAKTDTSYTFINATNLLKYDNSILGEKDALSEDGSVNAFYKLFVENVGNTLKVTFKEIPHSGSISDIISKETDLGQNEKNIIDGFDERKPIDGFDIKNLSTAQIKDMAQNIQSGINSFVNHKNTLTQLRFQASKVQVFNRMIKSHSRISSTKPLYHYAMNSTYRPSYRSDAILNSNMRDVFQNPTNQNSIYASVLGGYQKNTDGSGYIYGLNIGYDRVLNENLFLGSYIGYGKESSDMDMVKMQSDNMQLGIYTQANLSIFQLEAILGYDYSIAKSKKDISILSNVYFNEANYNTHSFDALLQIGPRFFFGHQVIKPYVGINLNVIKNTPVTESGSTLSSQYLFDTTTTTNGSVGIEYIKYFKNGYFFIRPCIQYTFYNSTKETQVIFLGNTLVVSALPKDFFGNLLTGLEIPINENFSINTNLSLRASTNKDFIAIGNASLKFLF